MLTKKKKKTMQIHKFLQFPSTSFYFYFYFLFQNYCIIVSLSMLQATPLSKF